MKFMPPKPEFFNPILTSNAFNMNQQIITRYDFEEWFEQEIKPLFENAITLYSAQWNNAVKGEWHEIKEEDDNVKAHLVNIQPLIEESESAEDILREWIKESNGDCWQGNWEPRTKTIYKKAKAYLERKK